MMRRRTMVVNKRRESDWDVFVGRGSKWGNPFTHLDLESTKAQHRVETVEKAVELYAEWLHEPAQAQLLAAVHSLRGKVLACYCDGPPCHAYYLASLCDALPAE